MLAAADKGVVIKLKSVPAIEVCREAANSARHCTEPADIDHSGVSAGKGSERRIGCGGVERLCARIVVDPFVVVAESNRVVETKGEAVRLFNPPKLPPGKGA